MRGRPVKVNPENTMEEFLKKLIQETAEATAKAVCANLSLVSQQKEDVAALVPFKEACEILGGVTPPTVYKLIREGRVTAVKIGSRTMIDATKLRRDIATGEIGRYKHTQKRR